MKELKVGLVQIARVNFDMQLAEQISASFRSNLVLNSLRVIGGDRLVTDEAMAGEVAAELRDLDFDLLLIFQATFADSSMVTLLANEIDRPIFLWAVPEAPTGGRLRLNSLCGINLAAHALRLSQIPYNYAYASVNDNQAFMKLRAVTAAASVFRRLGAAKLGIVGERPAGMDTCNLDEPTLKAELGVEVVNLELEKVFQRVRAMDSQAIKPVRQRLDARLPNLAELEQEPLNGTIGSYVVLKQLAQENDLDGIAVRCWPEFFTDLGCSACGAISMLTDGGIPSSCEADANGTITQLMLHWLSGGAAFGTDIVSVDVEQNHFVIWHCGLAPLSMADPTVQARATIHSNRKLPLLMEFPLKPGIVTIARISQATGELRLVAGRGQMLSAPNSFSGTSGVLRFERQAGEALDTILGEGLEHHIALTYGDHLAALLELARMLDIPVLRL
jgi:L-fucose isomerase-like protein